MSTRTKSFFEQDHRNGSRSAQWNRPANKAPLSESTVNTVASKPPIPATSHAKSKLKSFQFVPGQPEEPLLATSEKENGADTRDGNTPSAQLEKVTNAHASSEQAQSATNGQHQKGTDAPQLPHAHTFPCTPGTRLPLEDLIGNYDENVKRPEPSAPSPEEHIGWIPNSSSTLLTPSRKRKRARSSSPSCPNTSSQRKEASAFFASTAAQGEKKTPEADPAADLWQQYATGKQAEGTSNLPDFGQLMFQASPRKLETPAKGAGLRRWASTGNDWPSSKSKRRRTNGRKAISLWQDEQGGDSVGKSKVAAMVERLQESLASQKLANPQQKPAMRVDGPSSSSPLPEVGATESFGSMPAASPLQTKRQPAVTNQQSHEVPKSANNTAAPVSAPKADNLPAHNNQNLGNGQPPDSVIAAPLHLQNKMPLPAFKRPTMSRPTSSGRLYPQKTPPRVQSLPVGCEVVDEFGDDFELSAEDLEELMTQPPALDQRSLHQIPPQQPAYSEPDSRSTAKDQPEGLVAQPIPIHDIDDGDDEFGCDEIDEASLALAETKATQAFRISPRKRSPRKRRSPTKASSLDSGDVSAQAARRLQRYVVKQIVEGEYTNAKGRRCVEKVVAAEDEQTSKTVAITLRDSWIQTPLSQGTIIHIAHLRKPQPSKSQSTPLTQIMVSDAKDSPFIIVHPDHMLSATTVADSFDCIRRAVFQDRIKATGESSKPMVYGKILHEIFQQALIANQWDEDFLHDLVERTVVNHVEGLWELGMTDTMLAVEEVKAKMAELSSWAQIFVAETPSEVSLVDDKQGEKVWMSVSKLIAIEEHIWSPQYGLKGNIDATVQTTLIDHPKEPSKKLIVPFEVKTGRTTQSPAHRAQTALYTLLLSDRYDVTVEAGILYYLESSAMSRIAPPVIEIRQMIQQRNRLAAYVHRAKNPGESNHHVGVAAPQTQEIEESGLPDLLKNPFRCSRCYAQQSCFAYHALAENGTAESAGMVDDGKTNYKQVWQEAVGHLQLAANDAARVHALTEWFAKWERLLTFEESELSHFRKEVWTMDSAEREAAGRCFGNLVIAHDLSSTAMSGTSSAVDGIEASGGKINRFVYIFTRQKARPGSSFAEGSQVTVGEPIVVSSESGQWALANGYMIAVTKHEITVAVDRRLGNARQRQDDFDSEKNQALRGIMTVGTDQAENSTFSEAGMLYRIDKDEFSNGLALIRNNLVTLMSSHPIHTKLRNLLIFNMAPSFAAVSQLPQLPPSQLGEMNEDQRAAVARALSAQDYALILGMPGTGKTTTIAHVIRALLSEEKSILLTSYTHTAVDNVLLKIRDVAPANSILRLGVPAKINPQVQEFCQLSAMPRKTIDEIEQAYMGSRIVATTCMGTNHFLFNRRAFDVCIVDEASQITLPTSLGPLLHARKFVLVGDHYQLPPLVQNKKALEGGLDVSLFRQLSEEHPEAVAALGKQYRMCEDIMSLSNALIYNEQLRCGNDGVAQRMLATVDPSALSTFHGPDYICSTASNGARCWLKELSCPERKVVFANTDLSGKAAVETLTSGKSITNELEATLTAQLVLGFLAIGVPGKEIGVVTLYRSQLALMRQLFKMAGISSKVEIDSADRFQGRDKECIILSMVRSNVAGIVGDLLKDWRRVNVALTRAKSKLVVLGSQQTLQNNDLLAKFLNLVNDKGWLVNLPKDADSCHAFNFSSQAAGSVVTRSTSTPSKMQKNGSPPKALRPSSTQKTPNGLSALKESTSAGNRSAAKGSGAKRPAKVISGHWNLGMSKSSLERAAFEIFEDLTGDDLRYGTLNNRSTAQEDVNRVDMTYRI